jgi:membrane protease YdiL (CAAX protease family)
MSDLQFFPPSVPPEPAAERTPFWDWHDAALLVVLIVPSGLLALALTKGFQLLSKNAPGGKTTTALVFQFIFYGVWFSTLYVMLRFRYDRPFWQSMGWVVPWKGIWGTLLIGPFLALGLAILGVALHTPEVRSPFVDLMTDRFSVLLLGAFAVTLAPLSEELVFRGFFLPLLVRTLGKVGGVIACAVPFALLHGPQYSWTWQHLVLLTFAAIVFGVTRLRTGSTAAATLVHATYNLTFFSGYILQGKDFQF